VTAADGTIGPSTPDPLPPGTVRRDGKWVVGNAAGRDFAVSRRCRHQFADLSEGSIDADGCLVCPWHQSRYDVQTGEMVSGPRGFLGYHGDTPGYTQAVLAYGRKLRLRVGQVIRTAGGIEVRPREKDDKDEEKS
jgi:nitrite reductase/ring-hydroxylating ferredoxin subunit